MNDELPLLDKLSRETNLNTAAINSIVVILQNYEKIYAATINEQNRAHTKLEINDLLIKVLFLLFIVNLALNLVIIGVMK